MVWKNFDRNFALERQVTRAIDLAHSARSKRSHDLVVTKASAWWVAHSVIPPAL